jgi:hypothetical protein
MRIKAPERGPFFMDLRQQILTRQDAAFTTLATKREVWDKAEELFHGQLNDAISLEGPNAVFDPKLATLLTERSYRVMSQLPTGKVKPISKNDIGASQLMNLVLDKYVLPNASAQFDFLTKLRMVDLYSNLYGNFFTLTDWDVKPNGYVGPDLWLLNIRDVFHQVGAVSLEDSDYVIVRSWRPMSFFESLADKKSFKNVSKIVAKLKGLTGSKQDRDSDALSKREESEYPDKDVAKGKGYFEVFSMFERDRWSDFCVDADMVFRDIKNPHDNGELPVDCKYSIPLLDDFMGMGDMERGGSMQQVVNSNWNLYLRAVKMSIFPPVMINKDQIAADSSIRYTPAAKWMMRTGQASVQGAASTINLSPQGIATFNNTQQMANASLLNMFGTSDTSVTQQTDPGFGKTPQALKMQTQRENTRDNADRFYMEQFLKKVMKKMVNLISKRQSSAITIRLFDQELQELKRSYPEIEQLYDERTGKLTVKKSQTGSILYDYEIVSGSTYVNDKEAQQQNLAMFVDMYNQAKTPMGGNTFVDDLKNDGYNFHFGEAIKRIIAESGIQDWDKILEEMTDQEKVDNTVQQNNAQFQQVVQQMQMGQQNMNQIPPEPQGKSQPQQPNPMGGVV